MQYRRVYVEGGCYFFTLALADRKSDLLVREIDCLRAAFKTVKQNHPFEINAMVVILNHPRRARFLQNPGGKFEEDHYIFFSNRSIPFIHLLLYE